MVKVTQGELVRGKSASVNDRRLCRSGLRGCLKDQGWRENVTIPRGACLSAKAQSAEAECEDEDSQRDLAMTVLSERAKGDASPWAPFLHIITPHEHNDMPLGLTRVSALFLTRH